MSNLSINKKYILNFPRTLLFEAWISPDTVIPPVSRIEVDPKVGGFLKLMVETPQGASTMVGEFLTVSYHKQLVYTWQWDNNGEITKITVDFKEVENGTEISISHAGFHSQSSQATHDTGWDSYINGLIEKLQVP